MDSYSTDQTDLSLLALPSSAFQMSELEVWVPTSSLVHIVFDIGLIRPLFNLKLEIVYLFSIHTNPFYGKKKKQVIWKSKKYICHLLIFFLVKITNTLIIAVWLWILLAIVLHKCSSFFL